MANVSYVNKDTGLEGILSTTFGGVKKMMIGKNFPNNFRAFRILTEELLKAADIDLLNYASTTDLIDALEQRFAGSKTALMWIRNFIKPVFIMMRFVRAERDGEWLLHLECVREMLPYLYAAGRHNYAKSAPVYLMEMESLEGDIKDRFMRGEHTVRLQTALWNSFWTDMLIETTFMKTGKAPGGLKGQSLKPDLVKKWSLGVHVCSAVDSEVRQYLEGAPATKDYHKEEQHHRVAIDVDDRSFIRKALTGIINPLDLNQIDERKEPINIFTGEYGVPECNLHGAVTIGEGQLDQFVAGLPGSMYKPISKQIIPMSKAGKKKSTESKIPSSDLIYTRA